MTDQTDLVAPFVINTKWYKIPNNGLFGVRVMIMRAPF